MYNTNCKTTIKIQIKIAKDNRDIIIRNSNLNRINLSQR